MFISNEDLFRNLHVCSTNVVRRVDQQDQLKEMIKILIKLYHTILKDIVNHPESQVQHTFDSKENSECVNEINNLINDEESCNIHKEYTFLDTDSVKSVFLFKSVCKTLESFSKEFVECSNDNIATNYIGSKRYIYSIYITY